MAEVFSWKEEDKNLVAKLWIEGKSASEIRAEYYPHKTRNSIIGLVHRMNLPKRDIRPPKLKTEIALKRVRPPRQRSTSYMIRKPVDARKVAPAPVPPPSSVISGEGYTIKQLREHHCRDIIGYRNDALGEPVYCGEQKHKNTSFCEYHYNLYCIPPNKR